MYLVHLFRLPTANIVITLICRTTHTEPNKKLPFFAKCRNIHSLFMWRFVSVASIWSEIYMVNDTFAKPLPLQCALNRNREIWREKPLRGIARDYFVCIMMCDVTTNAQRKTEQKLANRIWIERRERERRWKLTNKKFISHRIPIGLAISLALLWWMSVGCCCNAIIIFRSWIFIVFLWVVSGFK